MLNWEKIYFDLDNTLYSHEYAFEKAIQDCYQEQVEEWEEMGIAFQYVPLDDWFDVFKYYSDFYWGKYERKEYSQKEYRRKRYMSTMDHFNMPSRPEDADRFHEKYYTKANLYVQPYPGLYSLLQLFLKENIVVGVITNGKEKVQWSKFKRLKLYRYIKPENFIISEVVGIEKPSKKIFDFALKNHSSSSALFIGDAWELDIVGALEAGWNAIYLNTQRKPRTSSHRPLCELHSFRQLLHFFQIRM